MVDDSRQCTATAKSTESNIKDLQQEYEQADDPEKKVHLMSEMRRLWKIILDRTGHGKTETKEHTGENGGGIVIEYSQ